MITENNFDGLTVTSALFVGSEEKENWIKETEIIFDLFHVLDLHIQQKHFISHFNKHSNLCESNFI
jgi:hypothetical protein